MKLPLLVFEEYVDKFQKKLASLKKSSSRAKRAKIKPIDDESEFTLSSEEDDEGDGISSMSIGSFLRKFDEVLPKHESDKFEFLAEAHFRHVIQLLAPEGRMHNAAKVVVQGVCQPQEPLSMIEFLEIFFSFAALSKEIGIPARQFTGLIVNKCEEWFPGEAVVQTFKTLSSPEESFYLLYSLARYVDAGCAKRIELTVFRKYQTAQSYLLFMHSILQGKHAFLTAGFWKIEKDVWDDEMSVVLQKNALKLILPDLGDAFSEEHEGFRLSTR
jgi:hypothetical protein